MVTIKDVAKEAGVGISTVSRVLNNHKYVREETRLKILKAIEKLNYTPNIGARIISAKKTNLIGVVVSNVKINFFLEVLKEIESQIIGTDYKILIYNLNDKRKLDKNFHISLRNNKIVDGLIIFSIKIDDEDVKQFKKINLPVVLIETYHPDLLSIEVNDYEGGYNAADFLIKNNFKKIAFIGWHRKQDKHIDNRFAGFKNCLIDNNISLKKEYVIFTTLSKEGGYIATKKLFAGSNKPQVIFYASDTMASGGYIYFKENKIKIPDDIQIMGFDDIEIAELLELTTMRQFVSSKTDIGINSLINLIENKKVIIAQKISISPKLIIRSSIKITS